MLLPQGSDPRFWRFLRYLAISLLGLSLLSVAAEARLDVPLETKIGQMLLVGFRGLEVDDASPIVQDIQSGRIGGVILFDHDKALNSPERNIASPEQLKRLVANLQAMDPDMPLFVVIDQEGGRASRLQEEFGFSPTDSQQWLGNRNDPALTARQTAQTLAELGINVNLAPVVDVNVNPDSPVIGRLERSFSADPKVVAEHALEVLVMHQLEGVFCALKHFPGLGSSTADKHLGFIDVTETWSNVELEPYRKILGSYGADMVMAAHVFNAALDPDWPATLSISTIQGLLRDQMGYSGVVVADDMQMQAITDNYPLEIVLERTILAGTDIIMFGNNLTYDGHIAEQALDIIVKLVREGRVPESRINESYNRIMHLKNRLVDRGDQDCRLCDAY
ncbi:beta-N-acetylhexosaminidase [Desulfonatronum thiosulfatophilum]|uniref:Beta-N-acetylhexosaminidase n=1 Tax=Desulfonatronum thiosulfatophilum TaxID=617002 RepID=A0A1G6E8E0_9BACT|nr:glycoside hydrolase family 3 N-terminal domain-containing protein [Desulfonatronum thiosulfatophilum]SDB53590.1 beta-N-acetylhexosaminidase [Desulfonatronum thiosulfatophilum]